MLNTFRARNNCELEAKFVQDRIIAVERSIAELCNIFAQYSRKAARLRDKGDELAKITQEYADQENINRSLSVGLENFADCISLLSSYGDLRVEHIETKVVKQFTRYEDICKSAKDDVKQLYSAREREINRKRQLDRVKERNPRNRPQIIQAETELVKATAEFAKTLHTLEERSAEFEKQKLHDMKSILLDFISVEMGYHAKALEVLTSAFNSVDNINEEADLQDFQKINKKVDAEFKKSLRLPTGRKQPTSSINKPRGLFRSSNSLGSLGALFSHHQKLTSNSRNIPASSKSEETLDSMKKSISESDDSESEDKSEDLSDSDDKLSPIVVRKYRNK